MELTRLVEAPEVATADELTWTTDWVAMLPVPTEAAWLKDCLATVPPRIAFVLRKVGRKRVDIHLTALFWDANILRMLRKLPLFLSVAAVLNAPRKMPGFAPTMFHPQATRKIMRNFSNLML